MKSSYIDHIKPGVLKWLESVRFKDEGWGRWKYNAHMCRPYGLQCSGLAIRILDFAGELENISQEEKRQAVDFFLSCQDPNDGYFTLEYSRQNSIGEMNVRLVTIDGKITNDWRFTVNESKMVEKLNAPNLSTGIYILQVITNDGIKHKRISIR